jgi:hypothetical protein
MPVPYHVGIVVDDVAASRSALSDILGVRWCQEQQADLRLDTRDGIRAGRLHFVYTMDGPPHLELIKRMPDSPWDRVGLHHLGFWSDNPALESARLDRLNCLRESVVVDEEGNWLLGLYHTMPDGTRFEIVDIGASGPKLARYLSGSADYA